VDRSPPVVEQVREDHYFRHQEIAKAHGDAVMAITMADDAIYTASRDRLVKRWKATKNASNKYELKPDLEVPLGDVCWCMVYAGEWLFCGLGEGTIRGYAKTGEQSTLKGHNRRVSCLLIHQHVLLSGGSDNTVRCWQMDPATKAFSCTHKIEEGIPGAVTCMTVLGDYLWVGGTAGVVKILLASLKVMQTLQPKKFVSAFLQFQEHVIVVYADGSLIIFDPSGTQKHSQQPLPAGPALCVAGLDSGPRVICGHAKGQISSITLPMFELKTYWQAVSRVKVNSLCCAGHDGIFIVGAENGNLQIWQRDDTSGL